MGLMALQQEFEGLSANLPAAPTFVARANSEADDPMADFAQALKIFKRQITIWRSNLLISIEQLRDILDKAEELDRQTGTGASIAFIFDEALPTLYEKMDEVEVSARRSFMDIQENPKLSLLEKVSPRHKKIARLIRKKTDEASRLQMEYLTQVRQKLWQVADEYDPENKPTGNVLKAGDDFDSWFDRIVAAE